jgi:hypothetical protein
LPFLRSCRASGGGVGFGWIGLDKSANTPVIDIKFLLLHDTKAEDPIRQFFTDVHEVYLKTLMNPFYEVDMRITSIVFDARVRAAAKKYL